MICFPQQQDNNSTEMVQLPLIARGCTKALIFYDVFKSQHAGIRLFLYYNMMSLFRAQSVQVWYYNGTRHCKE